MMRVGDAAEVQREGRRRPEPGRLYAAMQANSFVGDGATTPVIRCMQCRRGVEGGVECCGGGWEQMGALYSDIKRCQTRNSACMNNTQYPTLFSGLGCKELFIYSKTLGRSVLKIKL